MLAAFSQVGREFSAQFACPRLQTKRIVEVGLYVLRLRYHHFYTLTLLSDTLQLLMLWLLDIGDERF